MTCLVRGCINRNSLARGCLHRKMSLTWCATKRLRQLKRTNHYQACQPELGRTLIPNLYFENMEKVNTFTCKPSRYICHQLQNIDRGGLFCSDNLPSVGFWERNSFRHFHSSSNYLSQNNSEELNKSGKLKRKIKNDETKLKPSNTSKVAAMSSRKLEDEEEDSMVCKMQTNLEIQTENDYIGDDFVSTVKEQTSAEIDQSDKDDIQNLENLKVVPVMKEKVAPPFEISLSSVLTPVAIKQMLRSHKLLFTEGFTCFATLCPKTPKVNKTNNQLFINKYTGYFLCQRCNKEGPLFSLQENIITLTNMEQKRKLKYICMENDENVVSHDASTKSAEFALTSATPVQELSVEEYQQLLEIFNCDGIMQDTMSRYQVHYDSSNSTMLFPYYYPNGTLSGIKKLQMSQDGQKPKSTHLPRYGIFSLFGWNCLGYNRSSKSANIILTVNEFDTMAIAQSTNALVLGLPKGISSLPIQILPSLEQYKKIYLWFGSDIEAWDPAKSFAKKLGEMRCYVVRPSEENPSPLTAIQLGKNPINILRKSKTLFHKSIQTFSSLREHIRLELRHSEIVSGIKWKRFPTLNKLLKGHRRGELTVFTGPTGSGKTTFISEYSLDLCMQGVNTLWGSFEISNIKLNKLMLTQYALKNLSINIEEYDKWADAFEQLPLYFMTFHGQENHRKVIETMTHAVYIHDVTHIILDNLQFMMGVSSDNLDRFSKQDNIIAAFRNFATQMNCHVTLIIHPRKEKNDEDLTTASIFGSAKATQEADNVLILQDKRLTAVRGRKYVQVAKNRFDGELGVLMLRFDPDSKTYSQGPATKKKPSPGQFEREGHSAECDEEDV